LVLNVGSTKLAGSNSTRVPADSSDGVAAEPPPQAAVANNKKTASAATEPRLPALTETLMNRSPFVDEPIDRATAVDYGQGRLNATRHWITGPLARPFRWVSGVLSFVTGVLRHAVLMTAHTGPRRNQEV